MRLLRLSAACLIPVVFLTACTTEPTGPTIGVMPAPGKPFDQFAREQAECKGYASSQVAGNSQGSNSRQLGTAVLGTLLGAGLGAAIGGGRGAAIGAGAGALGGTAVGAAPANEANYTLQQRYDLAYAQCMYAYHNQVPGYQPGPAAYQPAPAYAAPPPAYAPPPPAYAPPPPYPPPGYYPR